MKLKMALVSGIDGLLQQVNSKNSQLGSKHGKVPYDMALAINALWVDDGMRKLPWQLTQLTLTVTVRGMTVLQSKG